MEASHLWEVTLECLKWGGILFGLIVALWALNKFLFDGELNWTEYFKNTLSNFSPLSITLALGLGVAVILGFIVLKGFVAYMQPVDTRPPNPAAEALKQH